jgi:hypothetical protein
MTRGEKCKNCKFLGTIYIPPRPHQEAIFLKGCFYFANMIHSKQVMYLDTLESQCECYTEVE